MAKLMRSLGPRVAALAAAIAALTQHGYTRWALWAAFALILLADVVWESRGRRPS